MFELAILIGIYSYLIFFLGILGLLNKGWVILTNLIFVIPAVFYISKSIGKVSFNLTKFNKFSYILFLLLLTLALINFMGALGPELGFDAVWYHLTLPKLYLLNYSISFIPGGLLYYSAMPKLAEMLYLVGLLLGNEIFAKLVHFSFGILTCFVIFKILRKFTNIHLSILGAIVFYSNLVVGWQSITAYVDLSRTFFETMALWGFLNFIEKKEKKWLIESSVILGLAISTKLISLSSLLIFTILIIYYVIATKKPPKVLMTSIPVYWAIALFIPLPWFIFSIINTGNPIYPLFTDLYQVNISLSLLNPVNFINDTLTVLLKADDPVSPIYLIILPLIFIYFKKLSFPEKTIAVYSFISIIVWYLAPRTGGGRFILPYLPAFSILTIILISKIKIKFLYLYLLSLIILISISSTAYRGVANLKYLPVLLGSEAKDSFLSRNLNFSFGDFYDTDNYFKKNIKEDDKVLLYGFHNLYYVNFPFIDSSFVKKGDGFNYIAVQNTTVPKRFSDWDLIYYNPKTKVELYKNGDKWWVY